MSIFSCNLRNVTCLMNLDRRYRFYAAFENTLCQDYVTEKVYKVLDKNMIPLLYGGVNYHHFLPPKSYINVADFASIEELANYLTYLSENVDEYIKYFWWKRFYRVKHFGHQFCKLCQDLHGYSKTKVYSSLRK